VVATASLGLATHGPGAPFESAAKLLEAADRSVYAAKRQGRNRLVTYDPKDLPATSQLLTADVPKRSRMGVG
jgi:predicted signal transduction protein with EAL and GGDEF domain